MSILSSTNSGIHQPITYDYLVQQGYMVSETHAIKISSSGVKYELSKRLGDPVYKAYISGEFTSNFNVSYHVYRENYTFRIKTIKDLKTIERYWDNPNPKTKCDLIYTVENTCSITYKS